MIATLIVVLASLLGVVLFHSVYGIFLLTEFVAIGMGILALFFAIKIFVGTLKLDKLRISEDGKEKISFSEKNLRKMIILQNCLFYLAAFCAILSLSQGDPNIILSVAAFLVWLIALVMEYYNREEYKIIRSKPKTPLVTNRS